MFSFTQPHADLTSIFVFFEFLTGSQPLCPPPPPFSLSHSVSPSFSLPADRLEKSAAVTAGGLCVNRAANQMRHCSLTGSLWRPLIASTLGCSRGRLCMHFIVCACASCFVRINDRVELQSIHTCTFSSVVFSVAAAPIFFKSIFG